MDISLVVNSDLQDLSFSLNEFDSYVLVSFLQSKFNVSSISYASYKNVIIRFIRFCGKDLNQIEEEDCTTYFNELDNTKLKLSSKNQYRVILHSFFAKYKKSYERKFKQLYSIPILDKDEYSFYIIPTKIEEPKIFSMDKLKRNLKISNIARFDIFVLHILLIFCGMRISEAVSIKISDIHLDDRYLYTGIEDGARKSNRDGNKPLIFIFPEKIKIILFIYISYIQSKFDNPKYLFPSKNIRNTHSYSCRNSFQHTVKKFGLPTKFHSYRKTLITHITKFKDLYKAEFLTNHKISSTSYKHYVNYSIEDRKKVYDESLDDDYMDLLNYTSKL